MKKITTSKLLNEKDIQLNPSFYIARHFQSISNQLKGQLQIENGIVLSKDFKVHHFSDYFNNHPEIDMNTFKDSPLSDLGKQSTE